MWVQGRLGCVAGLCLGRASWDSAILQALLTVPASAWPLMMGMEREPALLLTIYVLTLQGLFWEIEKVLEQSVHLDVSTDNWPGPWTAAQGGDDPERVRGDGALPGGWSWCPHTERAFPG